MALLDSVARFVDEFNQGENNLGVLTFLPEGQATPSDLLLNGQLKTYYSHVSFNTLITEDNFEWASLRKLPRYQKGWGIIYDKEHPNGIADTLEWNSNWLVFGSLNGDAVFTKSDNPSSPVYGSIQKARQFFLASSLETFIMILTSLLIVERDEFQSETQLEDSTPKPEFLARVREIVTHYENEETAEQFLNFFFG